VTPLRTACLECDLLLSIPALRGGERARCPRCGHVLAAPARDGLTRSLACALAAGVLLVLANAFPFMSLEARGLENVMTLPRTAIELFREGYGVLAVLVFGAIVAIPGLVIATLVALLGSLVRGRGRPWLVPAGRLLFALGPWNMAEVFLIGVVVSLVKISHMASVTLGLSFFAYAGFVVCLTAALASLDRLEIWSRIEACAP
jgi:paraquat-inducible protein A